MANELRDRVTVITGAGSRIRELCLVPPKGEPRFAAQDDRACFLARDGQKFSRPVVALSLLVLSR